MCTGFGKIRRIIGVDNVCVRRRVIYLKPWQEAGLL